MPSVKPAYRSGPVFKEVLELTRPDHLVIRQIAADAYIVVTPPSASGTEFIVATVRHPNEARTFVSLGAVVQFALDISGIAKLHFELISSPADREIEV